MTFQENMFGANKQVILARALAQVPQVEGALVEVGSWEGSSAIFIANTFPGATLHCIDHWQGDDDPSEAVYEWAHQPGRDVFATFTQNIAQADLTDRIAVHNVKGGWREAFEDWDEPIRLLWIDGKHTFEEVRDNIEAAKPFLVDGAIVAGDDFSIPGVGKAAVEAFGRAGHYPPAHWRGGEVWWATYHKPPATAARLPSLLTSAPIPRILHLVWVGSPVPGWVRKRWDAYAAMHPDWSIALWDDYSMAGWPLTRALAARVPHPTVLADLIRIEVVSRLGGVYVDSDTWPLRSLDPLTGERSAWVSGIREHSPGVVEVNNGAFGFPPEHPMLAAVWAQAMRHLRTRHYRGELHTIAGPPLWNIAMDDDITVTRLPIEAFNPLGWHSRYTAIPDLIRDQEEARAIYPGCYAIHEFQQSWTRDPLMRSNRSGLALKSAADPRPRVRA